LSKKKGFLARFMREAHVAIDLDHPNIVKGFDVDKTNNINYYIMEYVHGKSVERVLKKRGKIGERRAFDIIRQIASALEYANERSLIHRDIKPGNIIIDRKGLAKLADYGLVKITDDPNLMNLTIAGQVLGTPYYISPEQAKGEINLDIRSDIYSLGASLYHMISGNTPYKGDNGPELMTQHLLGKLESPKGHNPELSDRACEIVLKMMARDADKRYQNPTELLEDIKQYFSVKSKTTKDIEEEKSLAEEAEHADEDIDEIYSTPGQTSEIPASNQAERKTLVVLALAIVFTGIFLAQIILALKGARRASEGVLNTPAFFAEALLEEAENLKGKEKFIALKKLEEKYPQTPAGIVAKGMLFQMSDKSGELLAKKEVIATELFARSRFATSNRNTLMSIINDKYPETSPGKIAKRALSRIEKQKQLAEKKRFEKMKKEQLEMQRDLQRQKRMEIEREAKSSLDIAMLVRDIPDEYSDALNKLINDKKYKGTKAVAKAKRELERLKIMLQQEEKRRLSEKRRKEAKSEYKKMKETFAFHFFQGNINDASACVEDFMAVKEYSDFYQKAKLYREDCRLISSLNKIVAEGVGKKLGKKIKVRMNTGGAVVGRLQEVDENGFTLITGNKEEISRSIADIKKRDKFIYSRLALKNSPWKAHVLIALIRLTEGNLKSAEMLFQEVKKDNPYSAHHEELLQTIIALTGE
jgi:small nuclear ribonucleoprotein (snRNP)-like protein